MTTKLIRCKKSKDFKDQYIVDDKDLIIKDDHILICTNLSNIWIPKDEIIEIVDI